MTTKELNIAASVTPIEVPTISKDRKALAKEKLDKYMKEEMRLVKGIFQFFECPGMGAKIIVKKYKELPMFEKEMTDGQEYEIPLYVARHLNGIDVTAEAIGGKLGTCGYKISEHLMDRNGTPIVVANKSKRRFGFQSMEFAASNVA
jgi:hypothetical protein